MSAVEGMGLRFAPSILKRLGEELVPHIEQAIIELVRNAYDADATNCRIEIIDNHPDPASVVVSDNGEGMDSAGINSGWLVLGASAKSAKKVTTLGRHTVGDKGLGRLAALRAGESAELTTRAKGELKAHSVVLDWSEFDAAKLVEEVPVEIAESTRDEEGTTISLVKLRRQLTYADYDRLARNLVLLNSPFEAENNFRIELISPRYPEFEDRVDNSYLDEAEFKLVAALNSDGTAEATVFDWKGQPLYRAKADDWLATKRENPKYEGPAAKFELYNYILKAESFSGRAVSVTDVRTWLKVVGGVHIYHRQFRVPPYGDPGYDWLDMNLARARSPEERPSTNNSVGRVIIDDPTSELTQKTDRVGFIETHAFQEVRRFAKDALTWFARERLREAEKRREKRRAETNTDVASARTDLTSVISKDVPPKKRKAALKALTAYEKANKKAVEASNEELMFYRSLATAGATAAVFAHEVGKPIGFVSAAQKTIRRRIKEARPKGIVASLTKSLDTIRDASTRLKNFAAMQLGLLERDKRRAGSVDVHKTLRDLHHLWKPVLQDVKVELRLALFEGEDPRVFGSEALLEAIVTNCLTNIVRAYETKGARTSGRKAVVKTECTEDEVIITIEDNGLGIQLPVPDVWLPGRTSHATGTGFGLTIVRDSVRDMSGSYSATANGSLGGASFEFAFPRLTA